MLLKFDAFVFKVSLPIDEVGFFFESLGFALVPASARFGYRYCYSLDRGDFSHGLIQYGGDNVGNDVYIQVIGGASDSVRSAVLAAGWVGSLLRADIALDFNGSFYFDDISTKLVSIAKQRALKTSTVGDWIQLVGGRTLYVGSRSSAFMVRLYEKYKQPNIDTFGEETIRLEMEIKPAKHSRAKSFALSALDLVSSSSSFSSIYNEYFLLSGGITMTQIKKQSDHDRALAHLVKQYQSTLKKQLANCGGCVDTLFRSLTTHENWKND